MKRSKNLFKLVKKKDNGDVFCNSVLIEPLNGNRVEIKNKEFDVTPNIQKLFTITKLTTKSLDNNEKKIV